jgi:hypothetical protein
MSRTGTSVYPASLDSFDRIGIGNYEDEAGYEHTNVHNEAMSGIEKIQSVVGTTAGTSVLKDVLVGQFVATTAGTQTLTNKTLTSPVMTAPTLGVASATSLSLPVAADTTGGKLTTGGGYPSYFTTDQNIINIGTASTNLFGGVSTGRCVINFFLATVASHSCTFTVYVGIEAGVAWKFSHAGGAGATIAGTAGVFTITNLGDGRTYTLTGSTGGAVFTIKADATVTGTTIVRTAGFRMI